MSFADLFSFLTEALSQLTWQNLVMIGIGGTLIYLAIAKGYEPYLLLPIGFGAILANLPLTGITEGEGFLAVLREAGVTNELFPLLIFVGIGAMIDFGPLLENPKIALLGAAGQLGIYVTLMLALLLGFPMNQAASIGIIGAVDGPTAIYVANKLAPELLGAIAVAAYSYMALVPIIQPPVMRLMTTDKERQVRMQYTRRKVSRTARILFPIVVTLVISLLSPQASPLIATLMLGNLLRESMVVDRLSNAAQNEIANVTTLFLGLAIGGTMNGNTFIGIETLYILAIGLFAFVMDTFGGLAFGKLMYVISG
ncbi:MAG TPA: sodium ion-translocating decarboxylase subunit beta, partial [Anaerolineae bacterium]|nr:sodium ion-translocating decarboxylase subunit beta [Anaerolineae bacterium]